MKKQQAGMTLIELVIVIIVLGIIAAVAAPKFTDVSGNAVQAAIEGSEGGFNSGYTISIAQQQGIPTQGELITRLSGFDCTTAIANCDTQDKDTDGNPDLRVALFTDTGCTAAVTLAGDAINGFSFSRNGAAATCQTN